MSNSTDTHTPLGHLLALLPIGIAVGLLLGLFSFPAIETDGTSLLLVAIGTGILYGVNVYLAKSIRSIHWLGYLHVASSIALLTVGVANALYIIIIATLVVYVIRYARHRAEVDTSAEFLMETTGWISLSGITVLVEYLIYTSVFNQTLPFTELNVVLLTEAVITLGIGALVSILVGSIVTRRAFTKSLLHIVHQHAVPFELLLLFIAAIISVVLYQVNTLTFLIIIGFTIAQTFYEHRASKIKQESINRLQELSTLNNVAQAVSVNLALDDVLYSIYNEVNQLVNATLIFIALYDDDHKQIEYPLVIQQGKQITKPQRSLTNGLTDYVIRNKQSLYIRQTETERLKQLGIDINMMESQAYVGIPIMIGEKLLGVMGILNHHENDVLGKTNLKVLQSVVNQASLVLRNATLYDRTTQLAENLSLINQSVQDVMFNLDQEEALRTAAKTAMTVTGADQVVIFLLDTKDLPVIDLVQSLGVTSAFKTKLENAQPEWFSNNLDTYRAVHNIETITDTMILDWAESGNFVAFAGIPMRSGNTVVGYLMVFHEQVYHYHALEIDLLEMLSSQITVALDNADLLQALELYASEQAELVHLSNISAASLELEKVITDVSIQMRKMLKVKQVEVGLYVAGNDHIHVYTPHPSGHLDVQEYNLSQYAEFQVESSKIIQYPKIMLSSDSQITDTLRDYMTTYDYGMMTISPMVINAEVIGIIIISDDNKRLFKDNERRLIEMATTQIAAQIHNTQIHTLTEEALVQRLEQLSLIEDIGQKISRSLDLDLIINNVLEAAIRSTQADSASLALIQDDATMRVKQHKQIGLETVRVTFDRPVDTGVIGQILKTGVMRVISDNRNVGEYIAPPDSDIEYRSSLAVPLTKGDSVIGVLNIESTQPHFFTDEHTGFIKSLAGHAIISIDNANLLDQHQKQIKVLSQLRELALTASNTSSTDAVIKTVIQTAIDMLNGKGGILIPYDVEHKTFDITATPGWIWLGNNLVQDLFFIPDTLLYQVSNTEESIVFEDVQAQERYKSYDQLDQVNYSSIVIMPIKRRNQVTELLCITFKNRRTFSKQDHNTIQLLQFQVSNHLENARLLEEIRASNVRMRAILDSTRDGIILLDRDGNLQDANVSAEDLLGIDLSNFHNQSFATILMNHNYGTNHVESFAELIETARILHTEPERNMIREYTLRATDKTIYIREVSSLVWDSSNQIIGRLLSLRDVSDERAIEEFRSRLQSMIVHDLKSPLGAIITSMILGSDLLSDMEKTEIVDDLAQLMHVAQESASNLLELVESMLDIGKLQRKQMSINSIPISVQEIAETAYTSLLASFKQANIDMVYDIPDDIGNVYVDESLVRRVFVNLIQNALKFTPVDGEIRVTVRPGTEREGMVQVMVSDTGPGIPKEHRQRIFGEFMTIDDKTQKQQRGPRGQGLGLTFCKLTIEAHGGTIWIADEGPLSGATFVFTLPNAI